MPRRLILTRPGAAFWKVERKTCTRPTCSCSEAVTIEKRSWGGSGMPRGGSRLIAGGGGGGGAAGGIGVGGVGGGPPREGAENRLRLKPKGSALALLLIAARPPPCPCLRA